MLSDCLSRLFYFLKSSECDFINHFPDHFISSCLILEILVCQCQCNCRADFRLAPSQWETSLQCNAVSHWLSENLESELNCTNVNVLAWCLTWGRFCQFGYPMTHQMSVIVCLTDSESSLPGTASNPSQTTRVYLHFASFLDTETSQFVCPDENKNINTMMTSSNGNFFRVIRPLWGESTGHRWIPLTMASDAKLWCFLWSASEQTTEQTI